MMVASGDHAGPRRGTECRCVHIVVTQSIFRQRVKVGSVDQAAVTAELPEPRVVEYDEEDVWCPFLCPMRRWPGRLRYVECPADDAVKCLPRGILLQLARSA